MGLGLGGMNGPLLQMIGTLTNRRFDFSCYYFASTNLLLWLFSTLCYIFHLMIMQDTNQTRGSCTSDNALQAIYI
uniref:Uncharacterized protein n=1 Tax=Romanomermis culicivorax TaxID=13658 RepID=A0A915LCD7_ROMCU